MSGDSSAGKASIDEACIGEACIGEASMVAASITPPGAKRLSFTMHCHGVIYFYSSEPGI